MNYFFETGSELQLKFFHIVILNISLTGRRISREGGKAEGFDGRCRLDPRGCAALRAAQAADAIRRPVVAGAKRPRQPVIM